MNGTPKGRPTGAPLSNYRTALEYLAGLWENRPSASEDRETCAMHAATIRSLLLELEVLAYTQGDRPVPGHTLRAAVHLAREAGFAAGGLEICNGCGQRFSREDLEQDTMATWYCEECHHYGAWRLG